MLAVASATTFPTTDPTQAEIVRGLTYAVAFATVVLSAGLFPVLSALAVRGRKRGTMIVAALFCLAGIVAGQVLAQPWPRVRGLSLIYFVGGGFIVLIWGITYRNDPYAGAPPPRPRKPRKKAPPVK